ncbi:unnamed protein product [Protopolystoma xenopodis]|uniref:Uncharacterized protein n=1 Tax=Protopolystoma xenopodis TaxID=117903 RepID=A0A448WSQ5_9PLAT|nr:unnamed protein product [Protopolystoma xenopodis]
MDTCFDDVCHSTDDSLAQFHRGCRTYFMDAFKWVDAHREIFHVATLPVSSVHPTDPAIQRLILIGRLSGLRETLAQLNASTSSDGP